MSHAVSLFISVRKLGEVAYFTVIRYIGAILRRRSRLCLGSAFGFLTDNPIPHDYSNYTRAYAGTVYVA